MHCVNRMTTDGLCLEFGDYVKQPGKDGKVLGYVIRIINSWCSRTNTEHWAVTYCDEYGVQNTKHMRTESDGVLRHRPLVRA